MKNEESSTEEEKVSSSVITRGIGYLSMAAAALGAVLVVFTLFMTGYSVFQRYVLGTFFNGFSCDGFVFKCLGRCKIFLEYWCLF